MACIIPRSIARIEATSASPAASLPRTDVGNNKNPHIPTFHPTRPARGTIAPDALAG
ncbi:hypothetical protein FM112_07275 [Gulosibacter sp. 10]|nr:hypothetical protein FM112_07275 [Gulosibacter sp. 10]